MNFYRVVLLILGITTASLATEITVTIIYDNTVHTQGLTGDWGFASLVQMPERNLMFDTGARPHILCENAKKLDIDLTHIDDIIISHNHRDHTGGLDTVLALNPGARVWYPHEFPSAFGEMIKQNGGMPKAVNGPITIVPGIQSTGNLGTEIIEHSMMINTDKGVVVLTGCSHPGIIHIIESVKQMTDRPIYLVFGGFHLLPFNDKQLQAIAQQMHELGVESCGATHCTGENAIRVLRDSYGEHFINMGVGHSMQFSIP